MINEEVSDVLLRMNSRLILCTNIVCIYSFSYSHKMFCYHMIVHDLSLMYTVLLINRGCIMTVFWTFTINNGSSVVSAGTHPLLFISIYNILAS